MRALRFLQISDVHFGARLTGGRLGLDAATARRREQERRVAFEQAMAEVVQRDLDGVLIPGDLFDDESIDADTLRFVVHCLASVAPRPVFIAPGNHDPYGGASPYRGEAERENERGIVWPANVHVFAHEEFRAVRWPGREEVLVIGSGVAVDRPSAQRRLAPRIDTEASPLRILLFHGSRDDGGFLQAHKSTYPFSRAELLAQELDWVALGHYHAAQTIVDDEGRPRAAYSGCVLAGGLDEQGEKGALIVTLENGCASTEFVRLDPRRVRRVVCDLSGAGFAEAARARMESALEAAGARPEDLVLLECVGRRAQGLDLGFLADLQEGYTHLRVDLHALRADVDLDRYPPVDEATTTEERFVAALRARFGDADEAIVHRALLYGLDALHRGRLDTRYEE